MASETLVILFHGLGGSGSMMIPIAASWRANLPRTRIVAPDAPFPFVHGTGHQWFGIDGAELRPDRIKSVRLAFDRLVEDIIEREGFVDRLNRVAFVGVSQGAIVALDAVASGRWKVGALVSMAGLLPPIAIAPTANETPVLMLHGASDQTVPAAASDDARQRLRSVGFDVTTRVIPGLGHTVSVEELDFARDFLIKAFDI